MNPVVKAAAPGAIVPARGGRPLRFLRIAGHRRAGGTPRSPLRMALALACAAAAAFVLLAPSPLYRSEATLLLSGEAIGAGASLEGARIILAYLDSDDAARDLADRLDLNALLAPPGLDRLSRLFSPAGDAGSGALARELSARIDIALDERSGHVRLSVDAHRPADASEAVAGLLAGAETLVNRMGNAARGRRIVAAAERLESAEAELRRILSTRASRQAETRLLDPEAQAERDATFADRLRSESALLAVERARIAALTPDSPRLAALDERQSALRSVADGQDGTTAGRSDAIAAIAADDSLKLSRTIAVKALEAAHRRLETAIDAERAERVYLSLIAEPRVPDRPLLRPRGWQLALAAMLVASAGLLLRRRRGALHA